MLKIPKLGERLDAEQKAFLKAFARSCRLTSIKMLKNSQSGHPGGSFSSMEFLTLLYTFIISQTGQKVVISNGHISPGVYSVLAELDYVSKEEVIQGFRHIGSIFEGHITRHVPGVWYGTGPLGIGASAGTGFALGERLKKSNEKVFVEVGDGESQEGQVHEMIHFARKYKLENLIVFADYNKVQLSDSLEKIMPIDIKATFLAGHFEVIEVDGHDFDALWKAFSLAYKIKERPVVIIGNTIMGSGVSFMESEGKVHKATWHGNAPKPDQADEAIKELTLSLEEEKLIKEFLPLIKWKPDKPVFRKALEPEKIDTGEPLIYGTDKLTDSRTAYGKALFDLAKRNKNILGITADLKASVMTKFVDEEIPDQHFDCGIAEQHMVSMAGGLSLNGFIPFVSTFGAFMTSRAKDQARVNDINDTNVKMVATHCGLSVGEDGPTHQAIDDMGSFLGLLNTMIIEPADPNHTDRIIRYIASHYGNFYVRMGRHKFPVITKEDGTIYYDSDYQYEYGKCDLIREGSDITLVASGAMVQEAVQVWKMFKEEKSSICIEIIAASSIKKFDSTLVNSLEKTKKVITIEDHNTYSGLGSQLARFIMRKGIVLKKFSMMGVENYQLSGKVEELYKEAGISKEHIKKKIYESHAS